MAAPGRFGVERVLSGELKKIGAKNIEVADGKVTFTGDWSMLAKANIWLRTAERVLIVLDSFRAETFEELFQGVLKIPFEEYLGKEDPFPVKGWSLNSQLSSVPSCQSIIKRAAVKRMEQHYHQSWFAETGAVHRIQFSIRKNIVTIFLDSSGAGLHKRGYRQTSLLAPIKETLAAGSRTDHGKREKGGSCRPHSNQNTGYFSIFHPAWTSYRDLQSPLRRTPSGNQRGGTPLSDHGRCFSGRSR